MNMFIEAFAETPLVLALANFGGLLGLALATWTIGRWAIRLVCSIWRTNIRTAIEQWRRTSDGIVELAAQDVHLIVVWALFYVMYAHLWAILAVIGSIIVVLQKIRPADFPYSEWVVRGNLIVCFSLSAYYFFFTFLFMRKLRDRRVSLLREQALEALVV